MSRNTNINKLLERLFNFQVKETLYENRYCVAYNGFQLHSSSLYFYLGENIKTTMKMKTRRFD